MATRDYRIHGRDILVNIFGKVYFFFNGFRVHCIPGTENNSLLTQES
jgi:hypothetical protein